jgi:hypothetical protein
MSLENPLWNAPRIHGEMLKLAYEIAQSTVAKYMTKRRPGSGQIWKTFLRNHAAGIGAMDFLVVPTVGFRLLFVLVILRLERRRLLSVRVTAHPTALMAMPLPVGSSQWAFVIIRSRHGRRGRVDMPRG